MRKWKTIVSDCLSLDLRLTPADLTCLFHSYGVILYEVFSRKDPYEGEDAKEVLKLVADASANKRPPIPKDCPPQIEGLMSDCQVEDPEERPTFEEIDMRIKRMDISKVETAGSKAKVTISLFDIFPKHIAEALRDGREVESEHKDMVTIFFSGKHPCRIHSFSLSWISPSIPLSKTIFFSDIVGFTDLSSTLEPRKVCSHCCMGLWTLSAPLPWAKHNEPH